MSRPLSRPGLNRPPGAGRPVPFEVAVPGYLAALVGGVEYRLAQRGLRVTVEAASALVLYELTGSCRGSAALRG